MKTPNARRLLTALVATTALTTALTGCGNDTPDQQVPAAQPQASASHGAQHGGAAAASGSVDAQDQTSDGTTLTVRQVTLDGVERGFIGLHKDLDGKPGPVVGVAEITRGSSNDVVVTLDERTTTGAFWPMLHVDNGRIGEYEFPTTPGADLPVKDGDAVVMEKVVLTVE